MRRRLTCALCGRGQEVGTCTQAADLLPPLPAPHPGARRAVWLCKIGVAGRGGGEVPAASRQAVQTTLGPWHPTPKRTLKISKGHKSRFLGPQQGTPRKGSTVAMRWVRLRVRGKAEACAPPGFPWPLLEATRVPPKALRAPSLCGCSPFPVRQHREGHHQPGPEWGGSWETQEDVQPRPLTGPSSSSTTSPAHPGPALSCPSPRRACPRGRETGRHGGSGPSAWGLPALYGPGAQITFRHLFPLPNPETLYRAPLALERRPGHVRASVPGRAPQGWPAALPHSSQARSGEAAQSPPGPATPGLQDGKKGRCPHSRRESAAPAAAGQRGTTGPGPRE